MTLPPPNNGLSINSILESLQFGQSQFPVLGAGLWGEVLDMGDRTVLKLARRKCAGIGDGLIKIQREMDVLQALSKVNVSEALPAQIAISKPLDWGQYESTSAQQTSYPDAPSLWLRTTKLPGQIKTVAAFTQCPKHEQQDIAYSIADAIATTHIRLSHATLPTLPTALQNMQMLCSELDADPEASDYANQLLAILNSTILSPFDHTTLPIIHGDFNISNILFNGNTACAVVDFAETHRGFYEEDLAAIIAELPSSQKALINRYEALTGYAVSAQKLRYGLALKAFLSFAIARRLNDLSSAQEAKARLDKQLSLMTF